MACISPGCRCICSSSSQQEVAVAVAAANWGLLVSSGYETHAQHRMDAFRIFTPSNAARVPATIGHLVRAYPEAKGLSELRTGPSARLSCRFQVEGLEVSA